MLLGLYFKQINQNFLLFVFSILLTLNFIEIFLYFKNNKIDFSFKKENTITKTIKYEKTYLGYQPKPGLQKHLLISKGRIELW